MTNQTNDECARISGMRESDGNRLGGGERISRQVTSTHDDSTIQPKYGLQSILAVILAVKVDTATLANDSDKGSMLADQLVSAIKKVQHLDT